jgi:hypothetical protein
MMESNVEAAGTIGESDTSMGTASGCSRSPSVDVPHVALFDRLLLVLKAIVEYTFGVQMGATAGWLFGWCAGSAYVKHFQPVYASDLSELGRWELIPCAIARHGAVIGAVVGAMIIMIVNGKLLSRRVVSLYEKGITDPSDVARALGKSKRPIRRAIRSLAKKHSDVFKEVDFAERLPAGLANTC